ncbi:MAG: HlyD family efflux transporter periplasmic adaptor subunit [Clostridium sp.]|nr:HlyD family efflux transporter periplasmic adaptor subunit [Clostridium sp.]
MMIKKKQVRTMEQLKDSRLLYEKNLPPFGYMIILIVFILLLSVTIWSIKTPKIYMVNSSGTIESTNKNYIMSPYTGEITSINMTEGMNVEKGDVLFSVKSTDLDLQKEQLVGQKETYENQINQYEKLVKSIKDNKNYFDESNSNDNLYYSQYEAYKSQVAQSEVDVTTYKAYGYTDEQIEAEFIKNQNKITEIYYSAIKSAEDSILQCKTQLETINAQLNAIGTGKNEYIITANESGKIHMSTSYKEGMIVQAASAIGSIASEQDEYIVQAYINAADMPRINIGDKVDIVVSGLSQTVYGTISGHIAKIDSDITTSQSGDGSSSNSYFKAEVKLDNKYLISKNGDKVNISNGMVVETRIQYDKVTYFEYLLDALGVLTK